jgi:MFS transporter, ACS family, glucarate transporter
VSRTGPPRLYSLTHRVRWRIFAFLFGFGFVAYVQQKGLTVAAQQMMPALSLSQMQIGWLEWAFVLGYAVFQFPGGIVGQRLGARRMFTVIGLMAFAGTVLTPLAPLALSGVLLYVTLLLLQLLVGVAQAPVFPVSSGVMEEWFRPERWALLQGLQSAALQFAAAATPPIVGYLMVKLGWQQALFWPALPALALICVWAWYGRDTPHQHPGVSAAELAELGRSQPDGVTGIDWSRLRRLLTNRSILLLSLSYACMNYVFYLIANWCFLYLVQERHFNVLESSWLATVPPLAAGVGAGVGGSLVVWTCARFGERRGFRIVPMLALPLTGLLLLLTINLNNPYAAVASLALAYLIVELCEGPFWGATMYIGRGDTMAAGGILNTGGNGGGLIGIPVVAWLSGNGHWSAAFGVGAACALLGAVAWLGIDAGQEA